MYFLLKLCVVATLIKFSTNVPQNVHNYKSTSYTTSSLSTTDLPPFPQFFSFGIASGAYNVEGACNKEGKTENIWDRWIHENPNVIDDESNADRASDAYYHLEEDVEILNNLTVRHYKFSLSWSRILPYGSGEVNTAGVLHYQRLLQLLKASHIEPIVTIYNGDLPQALQDQGGFLSDQFSEWYAVYARTVFDIFGSNVRYWITFNDPGRQCNGGYGDGTYAPGINNNPGVNDYICGHNLIKAHANVYHLYNDYYRPIQKGKISIAIETPWYEPDSDCPADIEAAQRMIQFQVGWWAHPIYIGDYPQVMIDRIGLLSEFQGLPTSRLPEFTRKEIEWIKDTHDFFSINFLQTKRVKANSNDQIQLLSSYGNDIGVKILIQNGDMTYGIRKLLIWIQKTYYNPSILVAQDGFMTNIREINDKDRITYIHDILTNIRKAMLIDEARVYGYTYYSYIDGWEFIEGYTEKWGLYDVDFDCDTRPRTPKKSVEYYRFVCKYGCINDPCPPKHHRSLAYTFL